MSKKVILYTLQTFSSTGGIQKMSRTMAHSLYNIAQKNGWDFELSSAYDSIHDLMPQYVPPRNFSGFNKNRIKFVLNAMLNAGKPDLVILSHVNLAIIGLIIKTVNPKCKVWLIAHGIEVWRPLSSLKRLFLKRCDKIVCVSTFTKEQMIIRHDINAGICSVLNNAVDPFMKMPKIFTKPEHLLKRYKLTAKDPVIFTLTRLASTEQYKGHDQVIKIMKTLSIKFPGIKYVLSGQYDYKEKLRIQKLITADKVKNNIVLTGFLDEGELTDHFLLADMFVLPSKKEGFGIVFIEALACGLPVICGNKDGSIDAIKHGTLGKAINPDDLTELESAITDYLKTPLTEARRQYLQDECLLHFNESNYMKNLEQLINGEAPVPEYEMNG